MDNELEKEFFDKLHMLLDDERYINFNYKGYPFKLSCTGNMFVLTDYEANETSYYYDDITSFKNKFFKDLHESIQEKKSMKIKKFKSLEVLIAETKNE